MNEIPITDPELGEGEYTNRPLLYLVPLAVIFLAGGVAFVLLWPWVRVLWLGIIAWIY